MEKDVSSYTLSDKLFNAPSHQTQIITNHRKHRPRCRGATDA